MVLVARDQGQMMTTVLSAGQCGSCWAFSATEQIESQVKHPLSLAPVCESHPIIVYSIGGGG
jgi:hypothetical protein